MRYGKDAWQMSRTLGCLGLLLLGAPGPAAGQAMDLPVETQIPIFLKLLTFDRNLTTSAGTELTVGILFQGANRESTTARRQAEAELKRATQLFEGLTVRVVPIDLDAGDDLAQRLEAEQVSALYVTPLRAVDLKAMLRVTRAARVRTFSGVGRFVSQGVAMGAGLRGDLPQIVVNLPAAREEGADYPAQVLRLARVLE
jgi:hypothetical protein